MLYYKKKLYISKGVYISLSSLQSLDRALDMLSLIHANGGKMSVSSIAEIMNLHRSTVHRTLTTMYQKDFLSKDPKTGLYTIGNKALVLGFSAANNLPLATTARPYMAFLAEKYNNSVSLSVIEGSNVFVIGNYSGYYTTTFYSLHDDPLNCEAYRPAVAHCMLAYNCQLKSCNKAIQIYLSKVSNSRFKDNFFTNIDDLVTYLKKVKNDGYAYESGEYHFDELCYCAPILNNGKAIATLSIYGHKSYLNKFHKQDIIKDLLDISKTISDLLSNS